jgi:methylated-DNA-[protein]-cysteine S-methyltransferase
VKIHWTTMETPVGPVAVAWSGATVVAIHMEETEDRKGWNGAYLRTRPQDRLAADLIARFGDVELERADAAAGPAQKLARYFAGDVRAIDGLAVDPAGTPFQEKVWKRLREIPAGGTTTYGELAKSVGRPGAARAAGGAVGANPIPIVIPCHRVLAANGTLNGFGGGLVRKRWLLEHEGAAFQDDSPGRLLPLDRAR